MADRDARIEELAIRYFVSADAVTALSRAIRTGGGRAAQFSHSDLGGMGQWSRGGMTMIGDMFNDTLRQRVARLCEDVAQSVEDGTLAPEGHADTPTAPPASAAWWPAEFGNPTATGAQNDMRYAFFADARRVAIFHDGAVETYDTGEHRLSGFSQAQSSGQTLAFSSQHGPVALSALRKLGARATEPSAAMPAREPEPTGLDPFSGLQRLHELHTTGVVTTEEFAAKKQELLARI